MTEECPGRNWTSQTSGTTNGLTAGSYGKNIFVVTGRSGTILTSTDTSNWTLRSSGETNHIWGNTYGNNKFVAVGMFGIILTSSDGISWVSRSSGSSENFRRVFFKD